MLSLMSHSEFLILLVNIKRGWRCLSSVADKTKACIKEKEKTWCEIITKVMHCEAIVFINKQHVIISL